MWDLDNPCLFSWMEIRCLSNNSSETQPNVPSPGGKSWADQQGHGEFLKVKGKQRSLISGSRGCQQAENEAVKMRPKKPGGDCRSFWSHKGDLWVKKSEPGYRTWEQDALREDDGARGGKWRRLSPGTTRDEWGTGMVQRWVTLSSRAVVRVDKILAFECCPSYCTYTYDFLSRSWGYTRNLKLYCLWKFEKLDGCN